MIRVLIVDDHSLFRQNLRTIIESQKDMQVVGEAGDGLEAIKLAKLRHPDIILMDVEMPRMGGINATIQIRGTFDDIKVIALSSHAEKIFMDRMLKAGACDYLSKICSRTDLFECIRTAFHARN